MQLLGVIYGLPKSRSRLACRKYAQSKLLPEVSDGMPALREIYTTTLLMAVKL